MLTYRMLHECANAEIHSASLVSAWLDPRNKAERYPFVDVLSCMCTNWFHSRSPSELQEFLQSAATPTANVSTQVAVSVSVCLMLCSMFHNDSSPCHTAGRCRTSCHDTPARRWLHAVAVTYKLWHQMWPPYHLCRNCDA